MCLTHRLFRGSVLEVPLGELDRPFSAKAVERDARGIEHDQSRILETLRDSQSVLGGPRGAGRAARNEADHTPIWAAETRRLSRSLMFLL